MKPEGIKIEVTENELQGIVLKEDVDYSKGHGFGTIKLSCDGF